MTSSSLPTGPREPQTDEWRWLDTAKWQYDRVSRRLLVIDADGKSLGIAAEFAVPWFGGQLHGRPVRAAPDAEVARLREALRAVAEPRSCVNCGFEGYEPSDADAWCSDCETTQPASADVCPACHHDALGPACPMCGGSFRHDPDPAIETIEAFVNQTLALPVATAPDAEVARLEARWRDHREVCHNADPDAVIAHLHRFIDTHVPALRDWLEWALTDPRPERQHGLRRAAAVLASTASLPVATASTGPTGLDVELREALSLAVEIIEANPGEDMCRHAVYVLECPGEDDEPCVDRSRREWFTDLLARLRPTPPVQPETGE